jgi:AcrR family transcriptional regulator
MSLAPVIAVTAPSTAAVTTPRRRRKDARPAELLEAALGVFVEKGFAASRVDDVAARAGVSKGTLYLYYPSKESLLEAVIRHHLSLPIASGAEAFAGYRGPMSTLIREALTPVWLHIVEGPAAAVIKLVVTEVRNFPGIAGFYAREVIEPAQRLIGSAIERGIARREFRRVDVADTVRSIVLPMVALCMYRHSFAACVPPCMPPMTRGEMQRFIDHHLDLVLRGLARAPSVEARAAPAPSRARASEPAPARSAAKPLPRRRRPSSPRKAA